MWYFRSPATLTDAGSAAGDPRHVPRQFDIPQPSDPTAGLDGPVSTSRPQGPSANRRSGTLRSGEACAGGSPRDEFYFSVSTRMNGFGRPKGGLAAPLTTSTLSKVT